MNKRLNKAHVKNERIDSPIGHLGVPPDAPPCVTVISPGGVVIVTGDVRVVHRNRRKSLPQ